MNSARRGLRAVGILISPLLLGSFVSAQDGFDISPWYFQLSVGATEITEADGFDLEAGYSLAGAIGRNLIDSEHFGFSLEGEIAYARAEIEDVSSGAAELLGLFGNAVVDYRLYDKFGLYAVGGVGLISVEAEDDDESDLGFQFKTGIRYRLGESYSLALGYRYWSFEENTALDGDAHTFELGLTWNLHKPRIAL